MESKEWLESLYLWRNDPKGVLRWLIQTQAKHEGGQVLDWLDHRFLVDIACDLHPRQVVVKCAQVGMSTLQTLRAIYHAQIMDRGVIYALPTREMVHDFAATKVVRLLENNPLMKPTQQDSVGRRVYDRGYVLFRGTFGEREAIMVPADIVMVDEMDRANQSVVEDLKSRLEHSSYKGEWYFSNPSRPLVATDRLWRRSDQREWHVTCPHCNEEQPLTYWDNVDRQRKVFVCRKCHSILDDDVRRFGRWKPTNPAPEGDWHGYHISHLMAPWKSAAEIIEDEQTRSMEYFYNFVLGLPVVGAGYSVDPGTIHRARRWPKPREGAQRFIGVDVGAALHVVMGDELGVDRLLCLEGQDKWEQLDGIIAQYKPTMVAIDNAPQEGQAELQRKYRYIVYRVIYDYRDKREADFEINTTRGVIHAHRTRVIDRVLKAMGTGELVFYLRERDPLFAGDRPGVIANALVDHWSTLYAIGHESDENLVKRDRMGNVIRTWEATGPDHFAHATVYYWLAREAGRAPVDTGLWDDLPDEVRAQIVEDDDDDEVPRGHRFYSY